MEFITRTVYSSYLQTCALLKLPFTVRANSTLNEKFGIQASAVLAADALPNLQYFAIGNGGHRMSIGAGGIAKTEVVQHHGTDAALYNHLPFVLRETANDLTVVERAKYALRRQESHNGLYYYAYYLKRLDFTSVIPAMEHVAVSDGVSVVTTFTPDSSNLNPVPTILSPTDVNLVSADYTSATAKISISLSKTDVDELLNVARVLYNDDGYAIISEIALCTGIDKVVTSANAGNTTINFNEAIGVQVAAHVASFIQLKFSNNGVDTLLDVGSSEPILSLA